VAKRTVRGFIEALEKDKLLRNAVNFQTSMVHVARLWTKNPKLTEADIEQAIKDVWGEDCVKCLSLHCLSEVPGF